MRACKIFLDFVNVADNEMPKDLCAKLELS